MRTDSRNLTYQKALQILMNTLELPHKRYINLDEIIYLESDGNYTLVYCSKNPFKVLVSKSLCRLQECLSSKSFVRISRQHIINISYITDYWEENFVLHIRLTDGQLFKSSRRRSHLVLNSIKSKVNSFSKSLE